MDYKINYNQVNYEFMDTAFKANERVFAYSSVTRVNISRDFVEKNVLMIDLPDYPTVVVEFSDKEKGEEIYQAIVKARVPKKELDTFQGDETVEDLLQRQIKIQKKMSDDINIIKIIVIAVVCISLISSIIAGVSLSKAYSAAEDLSTYTQDNGSDYDYDEDDSDY